LANFGYDLHEIEKYPLFVILAVLEAYVGRGLNT
jgi:hypothetical protein